MFIVAGMILGSSHTISSALNSEALFAIGSVTLAIVLLADTSRINVSLFRINAALPGRLLVLGCP